jgi:outer membrane lipoprotein-sorting protein
MRFVSRAGIVVLALVACSAASARAQTVDEVVAKNLEARGGVERLKALESAKITGDVVQQGVKVHLVTWAKRPNLMRREMEGPAPPAGSPGAAKLPASADGKVKVTVGFDGNTVWILNPLVNSAPQQITGPQAEVAKQDADFDSILLDYKAKGHTIELLGTEPIDGKPTYHLKITKKNGLVQDYYLDAATGLERRTSSTIEQGANKVVVTTDLSDYRKVDGLTMPFKMEQSVNGTPIAQVTISSWEVNVPIDDALFKMPATP